MRFGDFSIPAKLTAVFTALVATIAATGVVVHVNGVNQQRSLQRMSEASDTLMAASSAAYGLIRQENSLRGFLLSGDDYYLQRLETVHRPRLLASVATLQRLAGEDHAARARADAILSAYLDYRAKGLEPVERLGGDASTRTAAFDLVKPDGVTDRAIKPAEAAIDTVIRAARDRISSEGEVQAKAAMTTRVTLIAGVAISALLTLLAGVWLSRVIAAPVVRLSAAMDRVRAGEGLDQSLTATGGDEIGRLTDAFNEMVSALKGHDSSLRRVMDELTEARDRAEAASVAKSQFLANMSHEIRTPLNGVLGMIQAIQMADLSPCQRERVDLVRTSAEALLAIVNDILDLSRIEAGKTELDIAPFDLPDLLSDVAGVFAPSAEAKGLGMVWRVDPDAAGAWVGDRERTRQVLSNLVSNAVKFTSQGAVFLEARTEAGGLRLIVRDTGIGIPAGRVGELFQKFTQLDGSSTRRFGGAGLGLAISRELVALMGGAITVDSVEGEGSRFEVAVPLARVRNRAAA
ncbi:MAG: ATP-binding protein [Pseudomonadota bacterium]